MPIEYNRPKTTCGEAALANASASEEALANASVSEEALANASVSEEALADASVSETAWEVGGCIPNSTDDECMWKMTSPIEEKEPVFDESSEEWGSLPEEGF